MKNLYSFLLLLFTLSTQCFSQEYFPIYRQGINYYTDIGNTYALWITDSTKTNPITYYFPNYLLTNMDDDWWNCGTKTNQSWLGKRMINYGDTLFGFVNMFNLEVQLYTNKPVGSSWIGYKDSTTQAIVTHVKDTVIMVLGDSDEVQIITNQLILQDSTKINYSPIWLSKHHGAIKIPNFFHYPYLYDDVLHEFTRPPNELTLISNSGYDKGIKNITWDDVYNYDIGDEFHGESFSYYLSAYHENPPNELSADTIRSVSSVLNKQSFKDSIIYTFKTKTWRRITTNTKNIIYLTEDTITQTLKKHSWFDIEPGTVNPKNPDNIYNVRYNKNTVEKYNYIYQVLHGSDSCVDKMFDAYNVQEYYLAGAGGPYYIEGNGVFTSGIYSKGNILKYYKKGNKTWGTPWPQNVGFQEWDEQPVQATVYPNPNNGTFYVNLKNSEQAVFTVMDITGQIVYRKEVIDNLPIELKGVAKGLYFYTITQRNQQLSGKLLLTH